MLYNNGTFEGINIPDIKFYYIATVMKTARYWHKRRGDDQWNQIKAPDINPHIQYMTFDKEAKIVQ